MNTVSPKEPTIGSPLCALLVGPGICKMSGVAFILFKGHACPIGPQGIKSVIERKMHEN